MVRRHDDSLLLCLSDRGQVKVRFSNFDRLRGSKKDSSYLRLTFLSLKHLQRLWYTRGITVLELRCALSLDSIVSKSLYCTILRACFWIQLLKSIL